MKFDGSIFFSVSILVLIFAQRLLQREIQIILLFFTRKPSLMIGIFSVLILPGVFVHEVSHLLMALILRVPVRKISFLPKVTKDGRIRMGFVQTLKSDVVRDSLIGLAPFIVGLSLVAFIGTRKLGLSNPLEAGIDINLNEFFVLLSNLPKMNDFGLWFYIAFAISTSMIPSEADRQSWKITILVILLVLVIVIVSGLGGWMYLHVYPFINKWLLSISFVLMVSIFIHVLLLLPAMLLRVGLIKLAGLKIA